MREIESNRKTKEEKQTSGEGLPSKPRDINAQVIGLNKYFHN